MSAQTMTDMGKIGCLCTNEFCKGDGLFQCKMRDMFFTLKSVHNKNLGPSYLLNLMGFNRLRIRYISKITDPEAHHGKPEVHYPHRKDFELVEDGKLFVLNFVDMDLRDARITLVGKHVVKFLFQCIQNLTT